MESYPLDFVPGPSPPLPEVLAIYTRSCGSPDICDGFFKQYSEVQAKLSCILDVPRDGSVVISVGEGMLALWSALKSCIRPGDKVLSIATGVFGFGVAEMAEQIGAQVEVVGFEYDESASDLSRIEEKISSFGPKLVSVIHCETPSGILNPIEQIGSIVHAHGALYYVDCVASAIGVPISVNNSNVDLGLVGSQKCLSLPPDLSIITVSKKAWEVIDEVNYVGYDALKPWKNAVEIKYFPYTHNWRALAALDHVLDLLMKEGLEKVYQRHNIAAKYCRERLVAMGIELFPKRLEDCSDTVTAAKVPSNKSWQELDAKLKEEGVIMGGSYGPLNGKVFRIGHMGTQSLDMSQLQKALDILEKVLKA